MITQGDATNAFNNDWLLVEVEGLEEGQTISKVKVIFGAVSKDYLNPIFPLIVNLTPAETATLRCGLNTGYLIAYDENGQPYTCQGSFTDQVSPRKG